MKEVTINKKGENYTAVDIGSLNEINKYIYNHPLAGDMNGKVFVGEKLDTTSMEISVQVLPAGKEIPFDHRHKTHEEVYIVLKGKGQFIIDGEIVDLKEGSFVRIAPDAKRRWRNNSNEDLTMMVIQAVSGTLQSHTIKDGYV